MDKISNDQGRLLASVEGAELSPKEIQAVRTMANEFARSLNSGLLDFLEEPLKTKFLEVKAQVNTMLASLPETDKVPAAYESNYLLRNLLNVMSQAQDMISGLGKAVEKSKAEVGTVRASIPTEVSNAIDAKVKAGELLTKDGATQVATDAVTAARSAWQAEIKTISDRRTALASANLPVPTDEALVGKDEEFEARKKRASERIEKLKGFSLNSARVSDLAWNHTDESFDSTVQLLTEATAGAGTPPKKAGNPFVAASSAATQGKTLKQTLGAI